MEEKNVIFYNLQHKLFHSTTINHNLSEENKLNIKKPNQLIKKLDPWFISGFIDGEGSFIIGISKNNRYKTGYQVQLIFKIILYNKDLELLSQIQSYFGVGNISKHGDTTMQYYVKSIKYLTTIISHFDKYPLITQKWSNYQLFKQALNLFNNKDHLTDDGFKKFLIYELL